MLLRSGFWWVLASVILSLLAILAIWILGAFLLCLLAAHSLLVTLSELHIHAVGIEGDCGRQSEKIPRMPTSSISTRKIEKLSPWSPEIS